MLVGFSQLAIPCFQLTPQLSLVVQYCQLTVVVCQICWLPAEKFQPSDGSPAQQGSFGFLSPFFLQFYVVSCMFHENQRIEVTTLRAPYECMACT
jgi:hypothetical protein